MLAGLLVLFLYVAFDINCLILFANKLLRGEKYTLFSLLKEGFLTLRRFLNGAGILIVLFISLLAPLTGVGVYVSLTKNLKIPSFISSVIDATPLYHAIYLLLLGVLFVAGLLHLFSIFAVVVDSSKAKDAFRLSRRLMKQNWKDYIGRTLLYLLTVSVIMLSLVILLIVLIIAIRLLLPSLFHGSTRMLAVFGILMITVMMMILGSICAFIYIVRLCRMYYDYQGREKELAASNQRRQWLLLIPGTILLTVIMLGASFVIDTAFEEIFVKEITTGVVAHRGGGAEGPENTVQGLEKALEYDIYGSEIDIQRTADGYYIINHDATFDRLCGVDKVPEEMTLEQIQQLLISDPNYPDTHPGISTFEEMLEASRGRTLLFVELKGATADRQMVDDAVRIIKEHGMEKECVLISLQYDIIDYAETTYPEMQTGYLMFASFGDVASLHCDYLGLEEETATSSMIDSIHDRNKKVLVWTPNTVDAQRYFLNSEADAIITDNVSQAFRIIDELRYRSDIELFLDKLVP